MAGVRGCTQVNVWKETKKQCLIIFHSHVDYQEHFVSFPLSYLDLDTLIRHLPDPPSVSVTPTLFDTSLFTHARTQSVRYVTSQVRSLLDTSLASARRSLFTGVSQGFVSQGTSHFVGDVVSRPMSVASSVLHVPAVARAGWGGLPCWRREDIVPAEQHKLSVGPARRSILPVSPSCLPPRLTTVTCRC